jgi:mRNA interferase MazF
MVVNRGEIWWADLPVPTGSEPGYRRPVLVIQADTFNRSRIATVIVVILTANLRLVEAPGNVVIPARSSGLARDSVANVSQIMTVDRAILSERTGNVPRRILANVEEGLRTALEL